MKQKEGVHNWYPFYVGDYIRKTAHLSLLEHGAYRFLLDHYYATGNPITADKTKLYRICRARTPSERRAVDLVVGEFFVKIVSPTTTESVIENVSLLQNKRCDREIDKVLKYKESQSAKAKLRHSHGTATAQPARASPQPQPHIKTPILPNNSARQPVDKSVGDLKVLDLGRFDIFDHLNDKALQLAKDSAKGWDIYNLIKVYNDGVANRGIPEKPAAAFIAWVRRYTKGKTL